MTDLIARLEKEGGSRELDAEIHLALDETGNMEWYVARDGEEMIVSGDDIHGRKPVNFPKYTTSLDAAIALCERVLPGWDWYRVASHDGTVYMGVAPKQRAHVPAAGTWSNHPEMCIALCIALLRALEEGK